MQKLKVEKNVVCSLIIYQLPLVMDEEIYEN